MILGAKSNKVIRIILKITNKMLFPAYSSIMGRNLKKANAPPKSNAQKKTVETVFFASGDFNCAGK
ncbi:hypothetical protein D3C72_2349650 [compost metagenome]